MVDENEVIAIEDLNVAGMVRNGMLSRAISDVAWGELRRQLDYKAEWAGRKVVVIDRYFPSSKRCSACGYTAEALALATRQWTCPACYARHDRDINAARNIEARGLARLVPGGTGESTRGELGGCSPAGETGRAVPVSETRTRPSLVC